MNNYKELIEKKYKSVARIPEGLLSFTRKIRIKAISYLNINEGAYVMDVGSGTGASFSYLEAIIGKNGKILGVEPSSSMMKGAEERIKKENWKNITLIENRVEEIEVDTTFDGALLFAMHDVFNSKEGLEKIHSMLKEGARIVCAGPKMQEKGLIRILNPFLHLLFKKMAISQNNKDKPWLLIEEVFLTERIILENHGLIFIYIGIKQSKSMQ